MTSVGIFGCGNMAQAMFNIADEIEYHTYTPSFLKADVLAKKLNGKAHRELANFPICDIYFLCFKPQQLNDFATNLPFKLPKTSIIVSVLAGIKYDQLMSLFDNENIVRLMPNTPSSVGAGACLLYSKASNHEEFPRLDEIIGQSSKLYSLETELQLEQLTGITGSGPAYLFELAKVYQDKMIGYGIEKDLARSLAVQAIYGPAQLLNNSTEDFSVLRDNVTSKGGVTAAALKKLAEHGWQDAMLSALDAAFARNEELSRS